MNKYDLTSEEVLRLLCGGDMMSTAALPEKGVESLHLSDGPIGLRYQKKDQDSLGVHKSEQATALLGGPALAATWNPDMAEQEGEIIGSEAVYYGIDIILGPAVNMVRNPLCGRNMEYYSEDPLLAGKIAAGFIRGVKKTGSDCCIKHFAVNNQETEREYLNNRVDEDALRELYLKAFEIAIREAKPAAVMTSLSKINGVYGAENPWLLTKVLRDEWHFDGIVMTDWLGLDDRAASYEAGLDLEMPGMNGANVDIERKAILEGKMSMQCAEQHAERIADLAARLHRRPKVSVDDSIFEEHHRRITKIAEESIVLLKNSRDILPLAPGKKIAVIGEYAEHPLYQAKGSGKVESGFHESALEHIRECNEEGKTTYAKGYCIGGGDPNGKSLEDEAVRLAADSDVVIFFLATDNSLENEGLDRKIYDLPEYQTTLLKKAAAVNSHIVAVVANGGAVPMPWADLTDGILECFYGGQGIGEAVAKVLFGIVNPSGHMPVSVPKTLKHIISWENYAHPSEEVEYREGLFMGYRGYTTKGVDVQWPFGYGLSYTEFEIVSEEADRTEMSDQESVKVRVTIRNTGKRAGAQVVQIYVKNAPAWKARPDRELRSFQKIFLQPGEEKEISFQLDRSAFMTWDDRIDSYSVPGGEYEILAGFSVDEIRASVSVKITPEHPVPDRIVGWDKTSRLLETEKGKELFDQLAGIVERAASKSPLPFMNQDQKTDIRSMLLNQPIRISHLMVWAQLTQSDMIHVLDQANEALYSEYRKAWLPESE